MRFSILSALYLAGSVLAAPLDSEKAADNYFEIISRRVSQVGSTMQSLESHLRPGAPINFDRYRQQEMQIAFFRKAIDLNELVTASMGEGSAEMQKRIPHSWKMTIPESTTFSGQALLMQTTLNSVVSWWSSVKNAAIAIGASRSIADTLSITQKMASEFVGHIIEHQNALTTATGL